MIRFPELKARFGDDTGIGGPGATPVLTRALERIGWRSVPDAPMELVAGELALLVEQCVRQHGDVHALAFYVARLFRDLGPHLDGGLAPVEAYLPAAEEVLRLYVTNVATGARSPDFNPDDMLAG